MSSKQLDRGFFERAPDLVAHDLIGSHMTVRADSREVLVIIVETEAYGGADDPASHAFRGPSPRSSIMFGPAGHLYVYLSYGIHWCMNVVTQEAGVASAVLIRSAEIDVITEAGIPTATPPVFLRGPGNLTRGLGVTGADNDVDCCAECGGRVTFHASDTKSEKIGRSRRIGISRGQDRLSRYFLEGSKAVSSHPSVSKRPN